MNFKEMVDENKEEEKKEEEIKEETPKEEPGLIEKTNEASERMEEANKEQAKLLKKQEELFVETKLQGRSMGGGAPKEEKLSDTDYAKALQRGEVNPLKEDGFI